MEERLKMDELNLFYRIVQQMKELQTRRKKRETRNKNHALKERAIQMNCLNKNEFYLNQLLLSLFLFLCYVTIIL